MKDAAGSRSLKGVPKSPEHRAAISRALKGIPKSPEHRAAMNAARSLPWEQKGYMAKHQWVRTHWVDPGACEDCGGTEHLDWASIGHTYTQERTDWKRLCRFCHWKLDQPAVRRETAVQHLLWEPKNQVATSDEM